MRGVRSIMELAVGAVSLASCGSSIGDVTGVGNGGNTLTATYTLATIGTQFGDSSRFIGLNDLGDARVTASWPGPVFRNDPRRPLGRAHGLPHQRSYALPKCSVRR